MEKSLHQYHADLARSYSGVGAIGAKRETILMILDARGVSVPPELCERLDACRDVVLLDRWLGFAATSSSADEILRDAFAGSRTGPASTCEEATAKVEALALRVPAEAKGAS